MNAVSNFMKALVVLHPSADTLVQEGVSQLGVLKELMSNPLLLHFNSTESLGHRHNFGFRYRLHEKGMGTHLIDNSHLSEMLQAGQYNNWKVRLGLGLKPFQNRQTTASMHDQIEQ